MALFELTRYELRNRTDNIVTLCQVWFYIVFYDNCAYTSYRKMLIDCVVVLCLANVLLDEKPFI